MPAEPPPMPDSFVRSACCWISPAILAMVASTMRGDPEAAHTERDIAWTANEGLEARSIGLEWLVREFLSRFRVPDDLIELSVCLAPDAFDEAVIAELRSLSFRGDVLIPGTSDKLAADAMLGILDRQSTVTIVLRPLSVIVEKALEVASVYQSVAATLHDQLLTFEHFQPEPFATYIELVVARSMFGARLLRHPFRAARLRRQAPTGLTLVSRPPLEPKLVAEVRSQARQLASTNYELFGKPEVP